MPAVIDTGGPRVLHCVERVERPIPRAQSIISLSRSTYRNYSTRKEQARFAVDEVDRCTENVAVSFGTSVNETGNIPVNDERNEFFDDERSSAATSSTTSSNDLRRLGALTERRHRFRDRKHYDAFQRRQNNRRKRLSNDESIPPGEIIRSWPIHKDVPQEINKSVQRCEKSTEANVIDYALYEGSSTVFPVQEPRDSSTISACHLNRVSDDNDSEGLKQSSDIVMRLFGGCDDLERQRKTIYRKMEKSSAAISSQRMLNCAKCEWRCESECLSSISDGLVPMKTESGSERSTRERRQRHRPRNQHNERSYVQLALLLFLVAFGNGNLLKLNFGFFGGKSASVGAAFGVLTIGTIVDFARAVPVDLDAGIRAERSANLSHISGASRKIQMYIKNRHLQILLDGTVNGSNDDTSEYTIFQRTSVSRGQLRIQGVATCLYLCMDSCGLLYGSREFTEECVFNETLEQHNYNTYSSVRWSTPKKSLYLGLNRRGQPRRVQAKGHNLGRLSAYARVLTQVAPADRVEALQARMLGAQHNLRHHHNGNHHRNKQQPQPICPTLPPQEKDGRDKFRCRKRKKRKKWKRRCNEGEKPGRHCGIVESHGRATNATAVKPQSAGESGPPQSKRSCEGEASEELCRKQALDTPAKKRKSRIETAKRTELSTNGNKQHSKRKKEMRMRKAEVRSNIDSGVKENIEEADTAKPRINERNGSRRKRPEGASKHRASSPSMRKKNIGRITRTTIAGTKTLGVTSPTSWYPGGSITTSTEVYLPEGRTKSTVYSVRNSVTSSTSKDERSEGHRHGIFRKGKSHSNEEQVVLPENSGHHDTSTDRSIEDPSVFSSSLPNDWSMETSEEAKSDESSIQDEETTVSFGEYSTLMTTMDTTSPERTEDYTHSTTESIINLAKAIDRDLTDETHDSERLRGPKKFQRETVPLYERLAM